MDEAARINFLWLLRLRWGAIVGQIVTIIGVQFVLQISLPLSPLFAVIGIEILSNALFALWAARGLPIGSQLVGGVMAGDLVLLTALLYLSGGAFNPFSFLYLVHLALAAVVLSPVWTWALVGLSLICFGSLFLMPPWPASADGNLDGDHMHMHMHLQGMWVAFAVAAGFIVYFVQRVTLALAEGERQLVEARELTARNEKLASLATLAAGAAHELSTPLSTIAVVAKELEHQLLRAGEPDAVADARLIREQVARCRDILLQMTVDAGESMGEASERVSLDRLLHEAIDGLGNPGQVRLQMTQGAATCLVNVPRNQVVHAIRNVLKNAQEASREAAPVGVRVNAAADECCIEVKDSGKGMSAETLGRAGEPFFTTKEPGRGMGLGLFLSRAVVHRLGGRLDLSSELGRGTVVRLFLPANPATEPGDVSVSRAA